LMSPNQEAAEIRQMSSAPSVEIVEREFVRIFGRTPRLYSAPGRVNLIGEHTDYNEGFVMPAAIDLFCWVAAAPRTDKRVTVYSIHYEQSVTVDLNASLAPRGDWSDYVTGTTVALQLGGYEVGGADIVVGGNVPLGAGLSSSAAIEVAAGYALLDNSDAPIDRLQLAVACRRGENEFVGARVGIMDQFIAAHGLAEHASMLDCRSLTAKYLPVANEVRLVVCNTGVKHRHAGGEYNVRRAQCDEGVQRISAAFPNVNSLRDVVPTQLEECKAMLPDVIYRRCRHVVCENERVQAAAEALLKNDLVALGGLMAKSHSSLRNDYEVSCPELDLMVEIASGKPGVFGSRMTGGGFGGCTINVVRAKAADEFKAQVTAEYKERTGISPDIYILNITDGVKAISAGNNAA
jgi:galactokinase